MNPKIAKADDDLEKINSRKRFKSDDDKRVGSEIFDKQTLETLYKLANHKYLDILNGAISTGKEANVLKGVLNNTTYLAVKIYRIATSDFKKMHFYIDGDPRFNVKSSSKRQLTTSWVNKEFRNLKRLKEAGVSCPAPITALNNVLILEFIGDSYGNPAQTFKNHKPDDLDQFIHDLLMETRKFIHDGKLIHGDLSSFNILNFNDYPVIIDVSQSVVLDHPIAKELFIRDIENLSLEFKKMNVEISTDMLKEKLDFYSIFKE
ncbi:serine protein kinase RIO [Methanobrevibacter filiformis]|uniref:non-specific serine/threonine protein kinase n=1 Tax=Methanobrevibacter filiformis TaxID=55758 RepID=A0A166CHF9_9EURY|nr:serine protein kinase RIO [Methanobrevibacter filiformis]KZX14377.1 RIO1 family protein [Methanobrevibacter filiformis]